MAANLLDGRLKLRHLVLAVAIDEHGTLVRAAEHLHLTQPVLTRGLRELEEIVGARLFDRGPRGMTATSIGRAFIGHAQVVLGQLRHAATDVEDLMAARGGTVRVGTHLAGSSVLPQAIGRLKARNPQVTVIVREATPDTLQAELLSGDLDLTVGRIRQADSDPRLATEILYREPVSLVVRPGHPQARQRRLTELLGYPWVIPVERTELRGQLEEVFAAAGVPLPTNRVECTSITIVRHLLVTGDAIGVVPRLVVDHDPGLVALDIPLEPLRKPVGLTSVAGRWASPGLVELMTELRSVGATIAALPEDS